MHALALSLASATTLFELVAGASERGILATRHRGHHGHTAARAHHSIDISYGSEYTLQTDYCGESFFDGWNFINRWDNTTHGRAFYVGREQAFDLGLAYVNADGQAVIKMDNTTDISNSTQPSVVLNTTNGQYGVNYDGLRNTVRLESAEAYDTGNLIIADFSHAPYGCAVWPSFWMFGKDWPKNGEIDVWEGWNLNTQNHMTGHTMPNCSRDPLGNQTAKVIQETCDYTVAYNQGCTNQDPQHGTYGPDFGKNGGWVFATALRAEAISIWRWERPNVPADVVAGNPQPSTWGIPAATWLNGAACDLDQHFGPQNLAFTMTTCGDADFNLYPTSGCPGTCTSQLITGANYDNAYFKINYVRVFKEVA